MEKLFLVFGLEKAVTTAEGTQPMPANPASSIILLVAMLAAFYFFIIRPQRKKDKEVKEMRNSLSVGDEIITIGGIYGKVVKISDETIVLELAHGKQRITFAKWALGSVSKKAKDAKDVKEDKIEGISADESVENQDK